MVSPAAGGAEAWPTIAGNQSLDGIPSDLTINDLNPPTKGRDVVPMDELDCKIPCLSTDCHDWEFTELAQCGAAGGCVFSQYNYCMRGYDHRGTFKCATCFYN